VSHAISNSHLQSRIISPLQHLVSGVHPVVCTRCILHHFIFELLVVGSEEARCACLLPAALLCCRACSPCSGSNTVCCTPLFGLLPGLPQLTALSAGRVIASSRLRSLPATLLHLELGICSPGVQLAHLTALTALHSPGRFLEVDANDSLPPNLHSLQVSGLLSRGKGNSL
jgi:hypothetical protein